MKNWIPTLKKILNKARISPMLNLAITDALQALQDKDLNLAYQLTACKSHITGSLEPQNKQYAFQEERDFNEAQLGNSVYGLLDNIHADIAWQLQKMPSGMISVGLSPNGAVRNTFVVIREMKPAGTHPVVKRIALERKRFGRK